MIRIVKLFMNILLHLLMKKLQDNSFLISKKLENDFLEVLSGELFTNVVLLDSDIEVL